MSRRSTNRIIAGVVTLTLVAATAAVVVLGVRHASSESDPPAEMPPAQGLRPPSSEQSDTVATLCVAGDIVAHMPLVNEALSVGGGNDYDFTYLFEQARPYYEAADYTTACLETTFNGPPYSGFPQFCAPDALARDLKAVGFDLLSTVGNHSLDTYYDGLARTLDVLEQNGLDHVGTYRTQQERDTVKIVDIGGIKTAFLGYTYGTNGLPLGEHPYAVNVYATDYMEDSTEVDYEMIRRDLEAAKAQKPDCIAVYMHWGQEYSTTPSEQQTALADFLFENGATLVLGGHVHVPQPMELRALPDGRTGFLCYCLGNLISNQHDPYTNLTAAVNIELTKDGKTGAVTVSGCEYIPMYMMHADASNENRYRLLDIHKTMQAYENGDQSIIGPNNYENLKKGLNDLHAIMSPDEKLK
ncbi:CapA family protein [Agathobaculum sp.]|uniref:CapA family protein n=1 Tax=Agathobaculum sp. TaxID=2048138 RepID=UPI002A82C81F|nr:CapA family protein [Agathobaculum sp.]MDY3618667.1 CapA family protein [Agathobaculum sp.]